MRVSLKLALIIILSFSLFGCQSEKSDVHTEIKTVASDSGDCQDVSAESLKEIQASEPDMALVEKRRAQLAKTFATGEGCPNCDPGKKTEEGHGTTVCPNSSTCSNQGEGKALPCAKNGSGKTCTCGKDNKKETQASEPDMALVEKRRAQLAKTFATGEGCPNCDQGKKTEEGHGTTVCPNSSTCSNQREGKALSCPKNGSGKTCTCGKNNK